MDNRLRKCLEKYGYAKLFNEEDLTFKELNEKYKNKEKFLKSVALDFVKEFVSQKEIIANAYAKKAAAKTIYHNLEKEEYLNETILKLDYPESAMDGLYEIVTTIIG